MKQVTDFTKPHSEGEKAEEQGGSTTRISMVVREEKKEEEDGLLTSKEIIEVKRVMETKKDKNITMRDSEEEGAEAGSLTDIEEVTTKTREEPTIMMKTTVTMSNLPKNSSTEVEEEAEEMDHSGLVQVVCSEVVSSEAEVSSEEEGSTEEEGVNSEVDIEEENSEVEVTIEVEGTITTRIG